MECVQLIVSYSASSRWSVYNSLFLTLPLLVLIVLSIILIARIVKLAREHRMNFSGCHSTGKQVINSYIHVLSDQKS